MSLEEMIHKAHEAGGVVGQIAIAEFILKTYPDGISPELKKFLESVLRRNYDEASERVGKPAEDVALAVSEIMRKVG